jgi:hypothetical protein
MRNLLAFLAALVLIFVGIGWYRGWYNVETTQAAPGHSAVKVDIDSGKIGQDLHKGSERLQEALDHSHKDGNGTHAESTKTESTKHGPN